MQAWVGPEAKIPPAWAEAGQRVLPMVVMTEGTTLRARAAEGVTTVQTATRVKIPLNRRGKRGSVENAATNAER